MRCGVWRLARAARESSPGDIDETWEASDGWPDVGAARDRAQVCDVAADAVARRQYNSQLVFGLAGGGRTLQDANVHMMHIFLSEMRGGVTSAAHAQG